MRFEFATSGRIIFGNDTIKEVGQIAAGMGSFAFVVTADNPTLAQPLLEQLAEHNIRSTTFEVSGEPTTTIIEAGVMQARQADSNMVIGIGGGSAIDTGKAIAAMLTNRGTLKDYLEVVGLGKKLTHAPLPYIAIPTTAGTGAEVTRNAVIGVPEKGVKVSMRSPLMLPRVALVDPVLTWSMPLSVTASTGLDALTQLIEAYVSNKANPLTDGICRQGLIRAARSLEKAYKDGADPEAREDMSLASLFGGLALANAKLGAVHGFAGTLGGMLGAAHGVICARLLPYVIEANVKALRQRAHQSKALRRFDEIARILTGAAEAKAPDAVEWIQRLCSQMQVPSLAESGLKEEHFPTVVTKARRSSSMKGNPVELTEEELTAILQKANNS